MPRQRGADGSLSKSTHKPAKWLGQWFVYEMVEGREVARHRGPKLVLDDNGAPLLCSKVSKHDAQEHLRRMVTADRAAVAGAAPANAQHTFASYWARFVSLKAAGWAKHTKVTLEWVFSKHVLPAPYNVDDLLEPCAAKTLGEIPLKRLTRDVLQSHLNRLASDGRSRSLLGKFRTYVKAMLDEAIEADLVAKNVARKLTLPKATKATDKAFLTPAECERLLAKAIELGKPREHLILSLCLALGPRRGEVLAFRRDDVVPGGVRVDESADWEADLKEPKTPGSRAVLALPPRLELELRSWMAAHPGAPDAFLFIGNKAGQPYRPANYLRRVLKPLGKAAGVEVNFQILRRTCATHATRHGNQKDVQGLMRHATPQMTMGVYAQVVTEGVRSTAETLYDELCGGRVQ